MESEQKFWLTFWAIIATTIISTVGLCTITSHLTVKAAMELGYVEHVIEGSPKTYWSKEVGK